jgi:hypothetical protein
LALYFALQRKKIDLIASHPLVELAKITYIPRSNARDPALILVNAEQGYKDLMRIAEGS